MTLRFLHKAAHDPALNVFVHLAENKDAERWRANWLAGRLVGINDESPYGYARADAMGCAVFFSKTRHEGLFSKAVRYALRAVLGFDFLHAWRQRKELAEADIIWTHTESQYLGVAAVAKLTGIDTKIIGQTVWLFDHWSTLSWPKKQLYRLLIERVDVLTFLSSLNMEMARSLFPDADLRFVRYGIPSEQKTPPLLHQQKPLRVLAIGNDRHRDWKTLVDAVKNRPDISLVILSATIAKGLADRAANIEVRRAKTNDELMAEFKLANVVCVPLKHNLHASGITTIEEAALAGVPVVATETGGLQSYFPTDEVDYVPVGDPDALREALLNISRNPARSLDMAMRAQARMGLDGLCAGNYIRDHVAISRDIMARRGGKEVGRQDKAGCASTELSSRVPTALQVEKIVN